MENRICQKRLKSWCFDLHHVRVADADLLFDTSANSTQVPQIIPTGIEILAILLLRLAALPCPIKSECGENTDQRTQKRHK
jgi:hypothetical protein